MRERLIDKLTQLSISMKEKERTTILPGSLFSGAAGHFLFRLYYQRFLDEPNSDLEEELIDFITTEIQREILVTTFCNGIAGFAWFLGHLKAYDFIDLDEDLLADFDEVVFETAKTDFAEQNHDFIHGALGNMVYLAERCKTPEQHEKYIKPLFDLLMESSTQNEAGVFWIESDEMLDESEAGQEVIRLHLSHGQASKIMVLAKMVENGFGEAEPTLRATVNYLLAQENSNQDLAIIAASIVNGKPNAYAHLGWCRGNISIAIVLSHIARVLQDDILKQKAVEIGLHTLRHNTREKAGIIDFAFCHGRTGLSHLYNRLYANTQVEDFQIQANMWMEGALNESNFDQGVGGFMSWNNMNKEWVVDYGLLSGTAGIGLSLLAHIAPEQMDWDSCFLLS